MRFILKIWINYLKLMSWTGNGKIVFLISLISILFNWYNTYKQDEFKQILRDADKAFIFNNFEKAFRLYEKGYSLNPKDSTGYKKFIYKAGEQKNTNNKIKCLNYAKRLYNTDEVEFMLNRLNEKP